MLLIEPEILAERLDDPSLVIIDLGKESIYQQVHVPGAHFMPYAVLVAQSGKTAGLLPGTSQLSSLFSSYGIDNSKEVIAYDDEGGGKAARLLWTLHCLGFKHAKMLNGGIHAWYNEEFPRQSGTGNQAPTKADFIAASTLEPVADSSYILENLDNPNVILLDARSADEYSGKQKFALRGGHIPGALHFEWTMAMDPSRNMRMASAPALREKFESMGLTDEKTIVCYCQTHHRSSFLYAVVKHLGYPHVKGYPGSWSDWGNRTELPIET